LADLGQGVLRESISGVVVEIASPAKEQKAPKKLSVAASRSSAKQSRFGHICKERWLRRCAPRHDSFFTIEMRGSAVDILAMTGDSVMSELFSQLQFFIIAISQYRGRAEV
jgi:hypothetical protein